MNHPALRRDAPDPLTGLLRQELDEDSLARSLGLSISAVPRRIWDEAIAHPLARFFEAPGKHLRARLVELACALAGGEPANLPPEAPFLVEMLHAGSLIVDDVEDGSPQRRGRSALHTEIGIPLAINAGNWLYFWPLALLPRMGLGAEVELSLFRKITEAVFRCHYGQALDLGTDIRRVAQREIPGIVEATTLLKTGSLFELSAVVGATLAGGTTDTVERIGAAGRGIGVGLQMLDDLSSVFHEQRRGKGHEDLVHGRPTWPWAWLANTLDEHSFVRLQRMGRPTEDGNTRTDLLADAMRCALGTRGRCLVEEHLQAMARAILSDFAGSPAAARVASEIQEMARSYG
jgi:geranylgeranyl pyrophosphate synthase